MAINAQNAIKADEAFKESKFTEALEMYQALLKKSPKSYSYTTRIISCFQQLERYKEAKVLIEKTMLINNSKALLVYLGYNYLLWTIELVLEVLMKKIEFFFVKSEISRPIAPYHSISLEPLSIRFIQNYYNLVITKHSVISLFLNFMGLGRIKMNFEAMMPYCSK